MTFFYNFFGGLRSGGHEVCNSERCLTKTEIGPSTMPDNTYMNWPPQVNWLNLQQIDTSQSESSKITISLHRPCFPMDSNGSEILDGENRLTSHPMVSRCKLWVLVGNHEGFRDKVEMLRTLRNLQSLNVLVHPCTSRSLWWWWGGGGGQLWWWWWWWWDVSSPVFASQLIASWEVVYSLVKICQ